MALNGVSSYLGPDGLSIGNEPQLIAQNRPTPEEMDAAVKILRGPKQVIPSQAPAPMPVMLQAPGSYDQDLAATHSFERGDTVPLGTIGTGISSLSGPDKQFDLNLNFGNSKPQLGVKTPDLSFGQPDEKPPEGLGNADLIAASGSTGQTATPATAPATPTPFSASPAAVRYKADIDALKQQYTGLPGQPGTGMPQRENPKWWQNLLSGALGGAAGYSNAAGRTRTPIDIAKMRESILYPGYADKMAVWQSQTLPKEKAAEISGQQAAFEQKAALDQSEMDLREGQAAYNRGLGRTEMLVTPALERLSKGVFKAGTMAPTTAIGQVLNSERDRRIAGALTPEERYHELKIAFPLKSEEELWQAVVNPSVVGKPEPAVTAAAAKSRFEGNLAVLASERLLSPDAITDVSKMARAISSSARLTDAEKNWSQAYIASNTTPASTGSNTVLRGDTFATIREYPVINKTTGQLEMRSAADINQHPGLYAPAGPGAAAMSKEAVFQDLHYNIDTARKAITSMDNMDAPTRAALAFVLRHDNQEGLNGAFNTFMTGTVGQQLNPQQQELVQALALLAENAMSLRSIAGMGQGAQDLRNAILATLPGAKSPTKGYALAQLNKFEQVVGRLEQGVPGMRSPTGVIAPPVAPPADNTPPPANAGGGTPGGGSPGGGTPGGGLVRVQIPGQPEGRIPAASVEAFKQKHRGAQILGPVR